MNKRKITGVIMVSIFMAAAFVPLADNLNNLNNSNNSLYIPAISSKLHHKTSIFNIKPSGMAYNSNNNGVVFSGNDPYIKLNNQYYPSQWSVLNKNSNRERLNTLNSRSINNRVQNSAVETLKNNNISVAYIYSFYGSGVHASVAIKNLNNSTANYTVQLNVILPSNNVMEISNNHSINKHFNHINGMNVMNIKRTYNPLLFGNVMVNPLNSIPSSTVIVKDSNYAVLNMQYHITLTKNETYTIDPVIKPMRLPGGGGGGGSCYPPPGISNEHVNSNTILPGQKLTLTAKIDTFPSYDVGTTDIYFQYYNGDTWNNYHSTYVSGTHCISYTLDSGYLSENHVNAVRVMASNSFGKGYGSAISINGYSYIPASRNTTIYNSNGVAVGGFSSGISTPSVYGISYLYCSGLPGKALDFATAVGWNNSSGVTGVNSISQGITFHSNSSYTESIPALCLGDKGGLHYGAVDDITQYGKQNTFMCNVAQYIIGIANSYLHGLIPNPAWFNSNGQFSKTDIASQVWFNCSLPAHESNNVYYPPGIFEYSSGLGSNPEHLWAINTTGDYIQHEPPHENGTNYTEFIEYHTSVTLLKPNNGGTYSYYSASSAVPVAVVVINTK